MDGITKSKASDALAPCAVGLVSGSTIFNCSTTDPGHPCVTNERQRIFMFRTSVNEMNVQPIDLGDELRQGVQFRLALAPIVFCPPVAGECLNRRELHALRRIRDCFPFRPLGCVDAPPQFGKLRFRKIRLKRANRILVCLFAGSLCGSAFGHGVPLSSRFGLLQRWTWRSLSSPPWKD